MPEYEFVCEQCDKTFSKTLSISVYEKNKFQCPECKSKKVKRKIISERFKQKIDEMYASG